MRLRHKKHKAGEEAEVEEEEEQQKQETEAAEAEDNNVRDEDAYKEEDRTSSSNRRTFRTQVEGSRSTRLPASASIRRLKKLKVINGKSRLTQEVSDCSRNNAKRPMLTLLRWPPLMPRVSSTLPTMLC